MHHTDKFSQHSSIIGPVWLNSWVFVHELSGCRFESRHSYLISDIVPVSSKEILNVQANTDCRSTQNVYVTR